MITLKPSLISSYTPAFMCGKKDKPFERVFEPYRKIAQPFDVGVDLYLFMEPDIRSWCNGEKKNELSAFQILAERQDPKKISQICEKLRQRFEKHEHRPIAITSFIPEIASKPKGKSDPVDMAIANLMRFTLELCKGQAEPVLQLVAGSEVDEVKFDSKRKELVAIQCEPKIIHSRILERVSRSLASLLPNYPDCLRLKLAFEMEPGPLHVLRNLRTVSDFIESAQNHSSDFIQNNVGLNLDLAHWYLSEEDPGEPPLSPDTLMHEDNSRIRSRIFHSHISGHSILGHFGDKPLTDIPAAMREAFTGWLRFLRYHAPRFSGYVSLEYEMAPLDSRFDTVCKSLDHLQIWLAEVNAQTE